MGLTSSLIESFYRIFCFIFNLFIEPSNFFPITPKQSQYYLFLKSDANWPKGKITTIHLSFQAIAPQIIFSNIIGIIQAFPITNKPAQHIIIIMKPTLKQYLTVYKAKKIINRANDLTEERYEPVKSKLLFKRIKEMNDRFNKVLDTMNSNEQYEIKEVSLRQFQKLNSLINDLEEQRTRYREYRQQICKSAREEIQRNGLGWENEKKGHENALEEINQGNFSIRISPPKNHSGLKKQGDGHQKMKLKLSHQDAMKTHRESLAERIKKCKDQCESRKKSSTRKYFEQYQKLRDKIKV